MRSNVFSPLSKSQEQYISGGTFCSDIASDLRNASPNSCFVTMWDAIPFLEASTIQALPPSFIELSKSVAKDNPDATVDDIQAACEITTEQRSQIAMSTISQSNSTDWHNPRKGRITSSNFRRVYTRMETLLKNPGTDTTCLVKSIMGYNPSPVTAALNHGKSMEPHAKLAYTKINRKTHKKFKTKDSGLVINQEHTYMAASPDLIVTCTCHGEGLCEIKCPYTIRDQAPSHSNWKHLKNNDGKCMLSASSPYYAQIQGQMAILQVTYCDLFVYTMHGSHLERIVFDATYWKELSSKITIFWKRCVIPELLSGDIYMSINASSHLSDHTYCRSEIPIADQDEASTAHHAATSNRGPLTKPILPLVYL